MRRPGIAPIAGAILLHFIRIGNAEALQCTGVLVEVLVFDRIPVL